MRRFFLFFLAIATCLAVGMQQGMAQRTTKNTPKATQQATKKRPAKKQRTKKKTVKQQPAKNQPVTISKLREEKSKVEKQRKATMKRRDELKIDVKKGVEQLMVLDTEIARQQQVIDTIRHDISTLDSYIGVLNGELKKLEQELEERKQRYMKSMRFMHRNRSVQSQLAFILSADNVNQMYRRMRFNREYASYQKAQGEAVMSKQEQVTRKREELYVSKQQKDTLLAKGEQAQRTLEGRQSEQKSQVEKLKKEQKSVQALIEQQQRQEAELNARIDKLIAEEIAREKARLEAEARKRAREEAEQKRQAELAKKRAKADDAQTKDKGNEKSNSTSRAKTTKTETAETRHTAEKESFAMPKEYSHLSGGFEANRGRLPLPITGGYQLVRGFGTYSPNGLSHVRLQSNGWHLKGAAGAKAQCIYNGVVSGVYYQGDRYIVTVRHGKYISVYINLSSVSVRNGQKVKTREILGALGSDHTMQFQLRNWNSLLNPAKWLAR